MSIFTRDRFPGGKVIPLHQILSTVFLALSFSNVFAIALDAWSDAVTLFTNNMASLNNTLYSFLVELNKKIHLQI